MFNLGKKSMISTTYKNVFVPERFRLKVISHVLKVCLDLPRKYQTSLILAIQGPAGYGKSFQTKHVLDEMGIRCRLLDSSLLAGEIEGDSVKPLKRDYCVLGSSTKISALIIDDFDMSIANQKDNYERTSNSDILNSFLMHLCDNPKTIDGDRLHPVPIIFTGNNFNNLYGPLLRHGRAEIFDWVPNEHEKLSIINNIFYECGINGGYVKDLFNIYSSNSISFFQQVKVSLINKATASLMELASELQLDRQRYVTLGRTKVLDTIRNTTADELFQLAELLDVQTKNYL